MRVRSVPALARTEVSVWLNFREVIVSAPQDRVAVGCVRRSSHRSITEEAVAKIASLR